MSFGAPVTGGVLGGLAPTFGVYVVVPPVIVRWRLGFLGLLGFSTSGASTTGLVALKWEDPGIRADSNCSSNSGNIRPLQRPDRAEKENMLGRRQMRLRVDRCGGKQRGGESVSAFHVG